MRLAETREPHRTGHERHMTYERHARGRSTDSARGRDRGGRRYRAGTRVWLWLASRNVSEKLKKPEIRFTPLLRLDQAVFSAMCT